LQAPLLKSFAASPTIGVSLLRFILSSNKVYPNHFRSCVKIQMVPLSLLRPGQVADVHELVGPADHVRRLEELGLRRGARLESLRGGRTCMVRIEGTTLCIRDDGFVRVLVMPRMSA
jgi:Fe2+ transport system protein FeoA